MKTRRENGNRNRLTEREIGAVGHELFKNNETDRWTQDPNPQAHFPNVHNDSG